MSKFNNYRVLTVAAAFGAVAILGTLSFGGSAEANGNPLSCQGNTLRKVVSCCEEMTKKRLPTWMQETGTSCNKAAACRMQPTALILTSVAAPKLVKRCYIVWMFDNHNNKNERGKQRG